MTMEVVTYIKWNRLTTKISVDVDLVSWEEHNCILYYFKILD
jgi:hypothetical protein